MGRLACTLVLVAALCSAAVAAPKPTFNVDFAIGWEGCYRPMEWTPVHVTISSNLKKAFGGGLTVSAQQDQLTEMTVSYPIVLTPDLPLHVPLVLKLAFGAEKCNVTIQDQYGIPRWRYSYSLWERYAPGSMVTPVEENELLVGLAGRPGFGLVYLSRSSQCTTPHRGSGQVHVKRKQTRMLPWDWTGYASLDLLILYDVDYQQMNAHQAEAIVQWVSNGGKLLMVLGGQPLAAGHPVASLLPFSPGRVRQVRIPSSTARSWGCEVGPDRLGNTLACWSIPTAIGRGWNVLWTDGAPAGGASSGSVGAEASVPYFAYGPAGFGRVGVLACDPSALGGRQRENLARFWVNLASNLLADRGIQYASRPATSDPNFMHQYQFGIANAASDAVLEHLFSIPELRPLSIWVVIVLLLALAVLIGPVDYFVLKRLDRLPLTWLTSAACVLLFTVAAYYGVRALRGGAAQVRLVSVVDGVSGTQCAWCTTYSGIFAPVSDNYQLESLKKEQWWSSVVPTEGPEQYRYATRAATRRIFCQQADGGNLPYSVPINIWTMQCLITEEAAEGVPFTAQLRRDGNQVTLTIANQSQRPISQGCVRVDGGRLMNFAAVPPKSRRQFTCWLQRKGDWEQAVGSEESGRYYRRSSLPGQFTGEQAYFAWGCLGRTRGIQAYLKAGAAVVCAQYDGAAEPFTLRKRRGDFNHIRMARLVVLPEEGSAP
ncbi:MAG: hypothetical protein AMJ81_10875 [Phycisphaerae bacterium SM23_33]|nr:MAG: hypothetical protein AMJ81_10875 [Phycisphaerae bacterium SM23_33]